MDLAPVGRRCVPVRCRLAPARTQLGRVGWPLVRVKSQLALDQTGFAPNNAALAPSQTRLRVVGTVLRVNYGRLAPDQLLLARDDFDLGPALFNFAPVGRPFGPANHSMSSSFCPFTQRRCLRPATIASVNAGLKAATALRLERGSVSRSTPLRFTSPGNPNVSELAQPLRVADPRSVRKLSQERNLCCHQRPPINPVGSAR
jgi:hypothetical protein